MYRAVSGSTPSSGRRRARLFAAIALLAAFVLSGCTGGSEAPEQQNQFRYVSATKKGTVIPEADRKVAGNVNGKAIDEAPFSLEQQRGAVVLINFWGTWCAPCVVESPQLDAVYREQKANGVEFVGVAVKDDLDAVKAFVRDNDISYPTVFDYNAKSALQLGGVPMRGLPATVMIDKQGRVAAVFLGSVLPADIEPVLATLLAEK